MIKQLERWGRRWLITLIERLFAVARRPVLLPTQPRMLVIRLDERLGNVLLTTPLLRTLKARFPRARIDVLANVRAGAILSRDPCVHRFLPFRKRALLAWDGPLACIWRLRRNAYDLCIDAANPTDPSSTQTILSRFCGATHTIGAAHGPFAALYSAPVAIAAPCHEIDLRLQLMQPVPGTARLWMPRFLPPPPASGLQAWLEGVSNGYAVVNVGARLRSKQLSVSDYVGLVQLLQQRSLAVVLTYGAAEQGLACAVQAQVGAPGVHVAPPTDVAALAAVMQRAQCVISADTGPMHLAVSVGTPTCAIFVSTDPQRFGYHRAPHLCIDARVAPLVHNYARIAAWKFAPPDAVAHASY